MTNAYVERGKLIREAIIDAHLKAGAAGMSIEEVSAAVNLSRRQTEHHIVRIDLFRAKTPNNIKRRTFHPLFEAEGKAYLKANSDTKGSGPAVATCEAVYELIKCSGHMGINTPALIQQTGLAVSTMQFVCAWIRKKYGLDNRRDKHKTQGGSGPMRYWQVGMMPPLRAEKRQNLVVIKDQTFAEVVPAQTIWPKNVKRTVAKTPVDMRYKVDRPERYFTAMKPGQYVEHDSAIARAYG